MVGREKNYNYAIAIASHRCERSWKKDLEGLVTGF